MRLTRSQQAIITASIRRRDPDAHIVLHGSMADDQARGGDIDLLVVSPRLGLLDKLDILAELHAGLGERRIDLTLAADLKAPFSRLAQGQGIAL